MVKVKLFSLLLLGFFSLQLQGQSRSRAEKNFEAFWLLFDQHYASFTEKNVNWDRVYYHYRDAITPHTSDEELFNVFCEMVKPLNDSHVTITAPDNKHFSASRPSRVMKEIAAREDRSRIFPMMNNTLAAHGFSPLEEMGKISQGRPLYQYASNEHYGYLRLTRCYSSLMPVTHYPWQGLLTQYHLEKVLAAFEDKEALILDIRFNHGGNDSFSLKLAGRFTDKKYVGYHRQYRNGVLHNSFSDLKTEYVKPRGKTKFLKPVILLTNDKTVSAADVLALIMRELPQVTIMGENTNGSFSDIYSRRLPNGWKVNLSNQRYFSADTINYEGVGVPVDIEVKNSLADVMAMQDPVIERAIRELEKMK